MAQTITLIQDILKEKYLPAFRNQIGIKPSPFLELIKKEDLTNNTVKAAATFGLNGGTGFGDDGSDTPESGPQMYKSFEIEAKNLYCNIEISDKTIKLASKDASAIIDAVDKEVRSAFDSANWNLGRALFMDGTGKLCSVTGKSGNTITVDDTRFLKEGMLVDILTGSTVKTNAVRIMAIDRTTNTVHFPTTASVTVAEGDIVTLQKSYGKEITGLAAIFSDAGSIYGHNKADAPWLKPIVVDAKNGINDVIITNAMRDASQQRNTEIDLIMMGDDAFTAYQNYMKEENVTLANNLDFKGGHTGYEILFGNRKAKVVNESFVPAGEVWGVATADWKFASTKFDFVTYNSSIFTLVPGKNYYRALLASYGHVICSNPGGCIRITNAAEA